jgi:hypothetical protein
VEGGVSCPKTARQTSDRCRKLEWKDNKMQHEVCYVIRPKSVIQGRLDQLDFEQYRLAIPSKAGLWNRTEPGFTPFLPKDFAMTAKLVFLADIYEATPQKEGLSEFFGEEYRISVEFFDRFWTLERYNYEDDLGEMLVDLEYETVALMEPTDSPKVNSWIEDVKEKKRR